MFELGNVVRVSCAVAVGALPSALATPTKKVKVAGGRSRKQRSGDEEGWACGNCLKRWRFWPLLYLSRHPEWRQIASDKLTSLVGLFLKTEVRPK
jgi:hypothetical protein